MKFKNVLLEFIVFVDGHKNSHGEDAPWVIKSHKNGKIISSHKSKESAKKHLQHIYIFK